MKYSNRKLLDDLLAELPRNVMANRNLWPGIARQIGRKPRTFAPLVCAASIAGLSLTGALAWAILHRHTSNPTKSPTVYAKHMNFDQPHDPAFIAARVDLEESYKERLTRLDAPTRAKIEASLVTIRQAHEDIREALAAEPTDAVLGHLLESTWHAEFDLYVVVVQATQPTMRRTQT